MSSMIRQIQAHHAASDGDMGFAYLAESSFWVAEGTATSHGTDRPVREITRQRPPIDSRFSMPPTSTIMPSTEVTRP